MLLKSNSLRSKLFRSKLFRFKLFRSKLLQKYATTGFVVGLISLASCVPVHAALAKDLATRCTCACVDGMPQTLCGSVLAAQQQTWVCPPSYTCPLPSALPSPLLNNRAAAKPILQLALKSPHPQAENCRAVRVWRRHLQAYTSVNVCDVQTPDP